MKNNDIIVQKSLMPFQQGFETLHLENCKTLQEIIDKTVPFNFENVRIIISVNGDLIPSEQWKDYKVTKGDIVGVNFIPTASEQGSGKNTFTQIAVLVAVAVASYFTVGWAAAAFKAGAVWTGIGWAGATIAISMVGALTTQALTTLPEQSKDDSQNRRSINSSSNAIDQYGIIPVNLGTNRLFPKQAALPYNELNGNDQYLRQLFTYGYGKLKITDRKIGENPLSTYMDVEYSDRLNADLNKGTGLYTNDVYQESLSIVLKQSIGYVTKTTQRDSNECEIVLMFPYGIYEIYGKANNKKAGRTVVFGYSYRLTGTEQWSPEEEFSFSDLFTKTLIKSKNFKFPKTGQYDVRIRRITADGDNAYKNFTESRYTGFKSVSYTDPVKFADISGTAVRIRATDQLNGNISSYNVVASTLLRGYNPDIDAWEDNVESSNPADIFRYVLQSPAFAKHLTTDKIDLEKLKEWWIYCDKLGLTYDRIIDYETSIDDVLNDICAAGVATLTKVNNIYSVIIDNERPYIKGMVTPRNSWDYSGNIAYPEIPHALRIEFRNKDKNYETDERIVYADGYDESNATLFERLQFQSCTSADLAYWYGRRYFATALLQPETHTFKMDFENLTFSRGDRISLVNDVILVGVGQGRITSLIVDDVNNPTVTKGFVIDDTLPIPEAKNLGVRIRNNNGSSFKYYPLGRTFGNLDTFMFTEPIKYSESPDLGSLCAFVEDGKELDLIITEIKPGSNQSATITAIDYAPERFKPLEEIPPFESNITVPVDFSAPLPPLLNGEIRSDESVMLKNADGSLISTMVIPLNNRNEVNVLPVIFVKASAGTQWFTPTIFKKDPNEIIISGLDEGVEYDIKVAYQRQSGLQLLSDYLLINKVIYVGGSTPPGDVQNFKVTVTNGLGLFEWTPNKDIDISHYVLRYSAETENIEWQSAQIAVANIKSNNITTIVHKGIYLIKAVDLSGNESINATVIKSAGSGAVVNVVEELKQHPLWLGRKERIYSSGEGITLDIGALDGYYYFNPEPLDLGEVYECSLTSDVKGKIVARSGVRDIPAIREVPAIRDWGVVNRVRSLEFIRGVKDFRTFSTAEWGLRLEMNLSDDGDIWTGWQEFSASQHNFRYCMFRLYMYVDNIYYRPEISKATVVVDMPDRYESGEDIQILDAEKGATIEYNFGFHAIPSVNVTVQNGDIDDKVEFIRKDNKGFTIKIFNGKLNSYVKRSFDYISAGYGKVLQ